MKNEFVFGIHAVSRLLNSHPHQVLEMWMNEGRLETRLKAVLALAQAANIAVQSVPKKTLDKLVGENLHQGVVIRCQPRGHAPETALEDLLPTLTEDPFFLILDGVQDPHNLGACLRTAEAAGVHAVIVPKDRACGLTPVVRKVASGAAEIIPLIQVTNIASTLRWLKEQNIWIIGTTGESETTLYEMDFTGGIALVMGAEGSGLRRLTQELCDHLVAIPLLGQVESLNVSVATGICLYEAIRQRLFIEAEE